jgi:hypothetical protein
MKKEISMQEEINEQELKERLALIESMMLEGRRTTQRWGWTIVLWGAAFYFAIAWSSGMFTGPIWGGHYLAWPVTMIGTFVFVRVLASKRHKEAGTPTTTIGRAIISIWTAMGISIFALLLPMGLSGRGDQQTYVAVISAMLGMANAGSGILLKWKAQFACAVVWWIAGAVSCLGSITQSSIAFLTAIFFCQIVFGIYCMMLEARVRKLRGAVHA